MKFVAMLYYLPVEHSIKVIFYSMGALGFLFQTFYFLFGED